MATKEFHIFDVACLPSGARSMRMLAWKYSRFQAKKALRRIRLHHPGAKIFSFKTVK